MRVVAVVPALDEAPRIGAVVDGLLAQLGAPLGLTRIVVVDDGSRDDTGAVARAHAARHGPAVEVIRHAAPRGVGASIADGYLRAQALGADAAVVLAGDGQMDPRDLPAVLAPLRDGRADYVQGDRLAWSGGAVAFPLDRLLGVVALALATRLATGLSVRDAQCGYTAIGRRALATLLAQGAAAPWPGYGYPNDVLVRLSRAGLRVAHVPIRPIYDGAPSKLRARHVPPILRHLARAGVARWAGSTAEPTTASSATASSPQERWRAEGTRGSAAPCL